MINIKSAQINEKLREINNIHPSLKFTIERESDNSLPLDMRIHHNCDGNLVSTWHSKVTDTFLIMNYYTLASDKYKRSVVAGMIHRIIRACSTYLQMTVFKLQKKY